LVTGGMELLHFSIAMGQRGWKGQPIATVSYGQ